MFKGYHVITLTHRTATLEEIGRLLPDSELLPERLHAVKDFFGWEELYFLSTCNRILIGFYTTETVDQVFLRKHLPALLRSDLSAEQTAALGEKFVSMDDGSAVRHIFEVASSMDSLVVGEREIVRQLRESYERSRTWGLTGDHYRLLISQAIEVSKSVFNITGIGEKALSVVALGYGEMRKKGIKPEDHIVLIGAGATNALLCKFLVKDGFKKVTIFNRSLPHAVALAEMFSEGEAQLLSDLPNFRTRFDAIVVCTGAVEPILTQPVYAQFEGVSSEKTVVDFSVPNNVSREVYQNFPVNYIEIESLREVARAHLAHRECARQQAEVIISERLELFRQIWHERQVERSLAPMIEEIKSVKTRALNEIYSERMADLDPVSRELLLEMMNYMEKKCVAIPVKTIKNVAQNSRPFIVQKEKANRSKININT